MKRGSELRRATPLRAKTPMPRSWWPRRGPSDPALPKHGRSKMGNPIPLSVRRAVQERAGGRCERCGAIGVHWHHRQTRSQGGQHTAENGVWLCVFCHDWAHANPAQAYATGWLVRRGVDPATVRPVPLGERVQ